MIEVFKTDIHVQKDAEDILKEIHSLFPAYSANFDLEDCDKILRIESADAINTSQIVDMLKDLGFLVHLLPDEVKPFHQKS